VTRTTHSRVLALACALVAAVVLGVVEADAKDFRPGDLRVCNATRCVPIANRNVVRQLGAFYYSEGSPARAADPRIGARSFELRFRNGYVTGIVATARLDRFLSYGVHLGHFGRGTWYRVPASISRELEALTAGLEPLRVTRAAIRRSR
jgi:hypothetical protein